MPDGSVVPYRQAADAFKLLLMLSQSRTTAASGLCSLVNNTAPNFCAGPYSPAAFPFDAPWHPERHLFRPNVAHFCALAMKLVYEQPQVIQVCLRPALRCCCTSLGRP